MLMGRKAQYNGKKGVILLNYEARRSIKVGAREAAAAFTSGYPF